MATNKPYYSTQGGGVAIMDENQLLVWEVVPDWFTDARVGDVIPDEWDVVGPFDRENNQLDTTIYD